MLKFLLAVLAMAAVAPAAFAAATPLDSYLDDMKTLRATFLQTLADAHGKEIDRSTGTLIVSFSLTDNSSGPSLMSWVSFV